MKHIDEETAELCLNIDEQLYLTKEEYIELTELASNIPYNILNNTFEVILTVEGMIDYLPSGNECVSDLYDNHYKTIQDVLLPETPILDYEDKLYNLLKNQII